jgi:tetratricopeptide (TPR) repeat protein
MQKSPSMPPAPSMPSCADQSDISVFPLRTVLVLLVGSIGASYWLVPRQDQLVERLFLDKQYHRMAEALRSGLGDKTSFKPSDMRSMTAEQLTMLSHLLRLTPKEQLTLIFTGNRTPVYDQFVHGLVLAAVRYIDVIPPQDAWLMIEPSLSKIPASQRIELAELLATNAHAVGKPALAAAILSPVVNLEEAGWPVARNLALALRWSGQTKKGAEELSRWLKGRAEGVARDDLRSGISLGHEMAMEAGEPSLALDFAIRGLSLLSPTEAIPEEQMSVAHGLALQCTRTSALMPWMKKYVASLPESQMDITELLKPEARSSGSFSTSKKWIRILAQTCDWNSEFDSAFDYHLRLAAMGEMESVDRCLALTGFLGRDQELADLLERMRPFEQRPGSQIFLARELAGLGRDVDAKPLFESWLDSHPHDRDARYDYACLIEDMGNEEGALLAFEELVRRDPKDVPGVKKLAEAYTRESRFTEALRLYAELPGEAHDLHTLENYAMLAESLDDYVQLVRALELTIKAGHDVSVEIFGNLAEAASHLEDPRKQVEVLLAGLKQIPESNLLRVSLASAFAEAGDVEQAVVTLTEKPALRNNMEAVALILSLAKDARGPEKIMAFVGGDVEKRFKLSNASLLDLAVLCRVCGEAEKSERVFASVIEDAANAVLIAEARFDVGDYETAERLMSAHMNRRPRAVASEWIFFGEIYEALGKAEEAKRAFDYSLALLTADLPGTAFSPPSQSSLQSPTP